MAQTDLSQHSSITFLNALQLNDEQLLKTIYTSNYPGVERYVLRNSGSKDDARDIYQEAFLAVWRNVKLGRFAPAREEEYAAYLARVARNKWIDYLRANKRNTTLEPLAEEQLTAIADESTEEQNNYINAVKKQFAILGERCRQLLEMFYFQKQSLRNVAAHFSWTEASAKNNKYRCLKQLRELVISKAK